MHGGSGASIADLSRLELTARPDTNLLSKVLSPWPVTPGTAG